MLGRYPLVLRLQSWATILGLNAVSIGLNSADHVLVKWRAPSTGQLCTAGMHEHSHKPTSLLAAGKRKSLHPQSSWCTRRSKGT